MKILENLKIQNLWQVPIFGALSGYLASLSGIPLPWMLGSLLGTILLRTLVANNVYAAMPGGRKLGQCIIGIGLGLHFTREISLEIMGYFGLVLACALTTLATTIIGVIILRRSGLDKATAYFASLPGGASEMVNFGIRYNADLAKVAAAHSLRLLLVVLIVPPIFGYIFTPQSVQIHANADVYQMALLFVASIILAKVWSYLKQPNPWVLGSLFACGAISLSFDWHVHIPPFLSSLGQWLIGCSLGCFFDRTFFRSAPKFLMQVVFATFLMILSVIIFSYLVGSFVAVNPLALILGMMPGGIAELTLTAEALQLSVALVTALHVLRLVLLMFLAAPIYNWWRFL